ncbi:MAG: polymer-forming cytoskeletal protein [Spirochaetes bacterium]|nr:polymer-forming cytoskeletal protein [Spirochaetota bacterium]
MARNDQVNSVIGEGSAFEGKFYIAGSLQIDGKFEGEVKTEDHLIIGPTGKVKTNVTARRVTVAGTLIGNIDAQEDVYLLETGRVLGNISTPKIHVTDGVVTKGTITLTGGQKKDIAKLIEESYTGGPLIPDSKNAEKEARKQKE